MNDGIPIDTVDDYIEATHITRDAFVELCLESYDSCNRATLGDIEAAVKRSGFQISKVELSTGALHVPDDIDLPVAEIATSGAGLLCWRRP